jgi:hypothetical protein
MRRRAALAVALLLLASCEYGAGVAPTAKPRIAVHAVLNPGAAEEVLLVERTLVNGRHCASPLGEPGAGGELAPCATDVEDPIVAAGGEPISDAEVVVYGPAGDSAVAVEDLARRGDGKGAGVYRFTNATLDPSPPMGARASLAVVPGATYRLRVTTSLGTASARTTVPSASVVATTTTVTFNVERGDFVRRSAIGAGGAAGYLAVLDAAAGRARRLYDLPVSLQASGSALIAGGFADPQTDQRLVVGLTPGRPSEGRVSGLDKNYVRALRAGSDEDPFSSENPGSSIEGGVGLFGSLVTVSLMRLDVVSFVDEPIEGRYVIVEGPATAPGEMRIYSYRAALSGSFSPSDHATAALFGTRGTSPPVRLDFYSDRFQLVRLGTFEGRYSGGELRGTYTAEGDASGLTTVYRNTP